METSHIDSGMLGYCLITVKSRRYQQEYAFSLTDCFLRNQDIFLAFKTRAILVNEHR